MKEPKTPKLQKSVPIATPDSDEVKQAGDMELERLRKKKGRGNTFFTNPSMRSGFAGGMANKTGSV